MNNQFSTIRSNVLMMDPLPSIAKVFSYAIQQERQINNNDALGSTSLINATNTSSPNSPFSCTYCGKNWHIVDRCYRKMAFLIIHFLE